MQKPLATPTLDPKSGNNEEFAKLDALLADLLSEVEQPILLNQNGTAKTWKPDTELPIRVLKEDLDNQKGPRHPNSILNERIKYKTISPATSSSYYRVHKNGPSSADDVIFEEEDQQASYVNNNTRPSQRYIKSKFDYFANDNSSPSEKPVQAHSYSLNRNYLNKNGYLTTPGQYSYRSASVGLENTTPSRLINSQTQTYHIPAHVVNNKPPLSPSARMMQQQTLPQQSSFRTISMNAMVAFLVSKNFPIYGF
jgi:hypothetical protein